MRLLWKFLFYSLPDSFPPVVDIFCIFYAQKSPSGQDVVLYLFPIVRKGNSDRALAIIENIDYSEVLG